MLMKAGSTSDPIYVFDLDGVITDPRDTQVNDKVLEQILRLLRAGTRVAVNTGRSYEWVEENLINYLLKQNDTSIFQRYIVICEKGGEAIAWPDGKFTMRPSRFAIPAAAHQRTREIFQTHSAQLDSMFWDSTKRTMATIEKYPTFDLAAFHAQQKIFAGYLQAGLKAYDVKIDVTTAGTDVESPHAGKHAGAELIYEWAAKEDPAAELSFISIGDSVSDYEMARYFAEVGAASTFVYVGQAQQAIVSHDRVRLVIPGSRYDEGALEFLSGI